MPAAVGAVVIDRGETMRIGIPAETRAGETRVAATAETVKKYVAAGHTVIGEAGAGTRASQTDAAYAEAGAAIGDAGAALGAGGVLWRPTPGAGRIAAG